MKRALLIHAGALGDFVMSLRIVAAVRAGGFDHVAILGRPAIASLAVDDGTVDEILDIDTGGFHALFDARNAIDSRVPQRLRGFDLAVDTLGGPATQRNLRAIGIPTVISIDPRLRRDWYGHLTEQWLADLGAAGLPSDVGPPTIRVSDDRRRRARAAMLDSTTAPPARLALIHPGSGSPVKCQPLDAWISIVRKLMDGRWSVRWLLGPVERERMSPKIIDALRAVAPISADLSTRELRDHLAASDAFLGHDSGVAHLAAAVGAPTLVIFGPTSPARWRPLGARVTVLSGSNGGWPADGEVLSAMPAVRDDRRSTMFNPFAPGHN